MSLGMELFISGSINPIVSRVHSLFLQKEFTREMDMGITKG